MVNENITIREAVEKDQAEILKIAADLSSWFDNDAITRAIPTDLKFHKIIVAEAENKIAGFLSYSTYEGHVFISWLGVEKSRQGDGIGTKLIKHLEDELLGMGINKLKVETLADTIEYEPYVKTRAFYEKMGFTKGEIKAITSTDGEAIELVTYNKELKD